MKILPALVQRKEEGKESGMKVKLSRGGNFSFTKQKH